ncbi:PKD domain-containing protein [Flammeovirga sp. EKP202]|uniref:PKD domain-containing protein n=1 Tax=Flammeovirga sp. EKP202 TaxID=2770592 RepID=UPI00165EFB79|nr:PKD domain-containing protein [Flammeovirga sp. EKP202]MBD0401982.1 PKD domain-containing protein [Flammeovirga sp. EKP202]
MKRSELFLGVLLVFMTNLLFAQDKPNILIIHTDEHSFKTVSKYRELDMHSGNLTKEEYYNPWNATDQVATPNMDRLGTEGAVSTKHYASSPTCTPSRASFITSLYPGSTGAARNDRPMHDEMKTWAHVLQDNGYSTSYVGKWHLEGKDDPATQVWGAGRNFGFDNIEWRIEKEHWTWFNEDGVPPYDWGEQGKPSGDWIYATEFFTDKAIEIMEDDIDAENPFCLMISIPDPHTPNHSAPEYHDWCRNVNFTAPYTYDLTYDIEGSRPNWADKQNNNDVHPESDRYSSFDEFYMQEYWGMVKAVDDNIGKMLQLLEDKGQLDNTIIIYTVDHGDMLFEYSRINKGVPYESSAKVPFMIRYPRKIPSGKIVTTPHVNVDVGPTILGLAGLPAMTDVHGKDQSHLYTSDELMVTEDDTVFITEDAGWWVSAATTRYKLVLSNKDDAYLIDLEVDPLETTNQLADTDGENYAMYMEKALELEASLKQKMLETNELYGAGTKFLQWMTSGPEIPAPPAVEVAELPLNPELFGFEGTAVVDGTAKRWSMGASNDFSISDEMPANGNLSLKFHHTAALTGNGGAAHAPAGMVKLSAGKYKFKAKVYVEAGSAATRFRIFMKNPSANLDPFYLPTTTGEWVDVSYDFTMASGTSNEGTFSLVIQPGDAAANGGTTSTVYFDDIEIEEVVPIEFKGLDPVLFGFEGSQWIDDEEKNWFFGTNAGYSQDEKASGSRSLNMSDVSLVSGNVALAAHSPIKSLYMNEGDYELSLKVKGKANNKIKSFDLILKDNKAQSLFIVNTFDISALTGEEGWVTLKKSISFGKDSDPENGQVTIRVREVDLNPDGEGFLFIDDIKLEKKTSDVVDGGTDPADETPKDVPNDPSDMNYLNSHLFGFEGPTLIDLGSGKVRVRWTGDSEFGIVDLNGNPHGKRVMRFSNDGVLNKTKSVYVDKNSAPLPTDRNLQFSMKVFIEEGSTINKVRVADLTSPVTQFDLTGIPQGEWVVLKKEIAPDELNDFKRIKLQIQVADAGEKTSIYFDDVRVTDVQEEVVADGCMNNPNSLINSCAFGFEENTTSADWATNAIYSITDEMAWGGSSSLKVQIDTEIASGNYNQTPKSGLQSNVTIEEEHMMVSFKLYIDAAATLSQISLLSKFNNTAPQVLAVDISQMEKGKWLTVEQEVAVKNFSESALLNWVGFRFNNNTDGTGVLYIDDVKAVVKSVFVGDQERTVLFTVMDENDAPIEGAVVKVSGFDDQTTDANGNVSLMSSNIEGKAYTIEKDGFNLKEGQFSVYNADVTVDVMMKTFVPETYSFTILLKDESGKPMPGVVVTNTDNAETFTTDVRGAVVFMGLSESDIINYTVDLEGFDPITNSKTIGTENSSVTETLVRKLFAPDAMFTVNRVTGDKPLTVSFKDESAHLPTAWLWNFGDGGTSVDQNPFYTYQTAGVYTVSLKVTNDTGEDELIKEDYITVGVLPTAEFSANTTQVDEGTAVQFTDESTTTITSWAWDFGDGTTSNEQHPSHTYASVGQFTVKLKVTNEDGEDELVKENYINVVAVPELEATFAYNVLSFDDPKTIKFMDTSAGEVTSWSWDFGDGATSNEQNPEHTYADGGTYQVSLKIANDKKEATATQSIEVSAVTYDVVYTNNFSEYDVNAALLEEERTDARKFHYVAFQQPDLPRTLTVLEEEGNQYMQYGDGGASASANGQIRTNTVIEFKAGKKYILSVRTRGVAIHFPLIMDVESNAPRAKGDQYKDGTTSDWYTHTLTFEAAEDFNATIAMARNWYGTLDIDDIVLLTEHVDEPEVQVNFTASSMEVTLGTEIQFTDTSEGAPTAWAWDFGDQTTSDVQNPAHTYTAAGTYTVTLTASNASSSAEKEMTITVNPQPVLPVAAFSADKTTVEENETVTFTDASTDATSWSWDFGDQTTSDEQNPTHAYTTAGTYTVTLTVTNADGQDEEVKTDYITVTEEVVSVLPVADFTASKTEIILGEAIVFTDASTDATSWSWDFGDATTSTDQNPSHTYASEGTFTVTLTVMNGDLSDSKTLDIVVNPDNVINMPVASFNASVTEAKVNEEITFTDASTDATSWSWDFGDGTTSDVQNPTHTYAAVGIYTVALTVSNENGSDTSSQQDLITITEADPTSITIDGVEIKVYPNPASSEVNVVSADVVNVTIFTATGQLIQSIDKTTASIKIPVEGWSSGLYLFKMTTKNGSQYTTKVQVK